MSLPIFMSGKLKKAQGISMVIHRPHDNPDQESHEAPIRSAAEDILKAIEAKDVQGLAMALTAAFHILDSEPRVVGEHIEESE